MIPVWNFFIDWTDHLTEHFFVEVQNLYEMSLVFSNFSFIYSFDIFLFCFYHRFALSPALWGPSVNHSLVFLSCQIQIDVHKMLWFLCLYKKRFFFAELNIEKMEVHRLHSAHLPTTKLSPPIQNLIGISLWNSKLYIPCTINIWKKVLTKAIF